MNNNSQEYYLIENSNGKHLFLNGQISLKSKDFSLNITVENLFDLIKKAIPAVVSPKNSFTFRIDGW